METYRKRPLLGIIVLLAATVIWGFAYIAQSDAMQYLEVLTYSGLRILAGAVALLPIALINWRGDFNQKAVSQGFRRTSLQTTVRGGVVCGIFMGAAIVFQQYGIANGSVGKAGFLTALYIVLVPVIGILFGRRVTWTVTACVLIAVAGSWFLCVKEKDLSISFADWMLIGDAVLFAFQILFIDRYLSLGANPVCMACVEFWTAGLILLPLMFLFEHPSWEGILPAWKTILYAGLASGAVGYTLQMIGQRELEPAGASLLMSLESVFAALFGWIILGEKMTPREILGCGLVMAAVVLSQVPIGKNAAKAKP